MRRVQDYTTYCQPLPGNAIEEENVSRGISRRGLSPANKHTKRASDKNVLSMRIEG